MGTSVNQSAATAPPRNHRTSHLSRRGINIATFDRLADAEELREILERRGIVAWVQDERRLQRYWFIAHPQAGIHVRVPESLTELAQEELDSNRRQWHFAMCRFLSLLPFLPGGIPSHDAQERSPDAHCPTGGGVWFD
jgi:hypothetical protein